MRLWPILLLTAALARAQGPSPEGWWKTVDDKTGRVKSIVHITRGGDTLSGKVEKLFRLPEEIQDPMCIKCSGDRKDKRIVGMTIMWGLRPSGDAWDHGSVLDPANGKVYSCKLTLSPDNQSLTVRGYLGISLIGRSQTWKRVSPDEPGKPAAPGS